MNYRFWTAASAAALSLALVATGPALSDGLRGQVGTQLNEHNIKVADFDSLTDTQISQIALIMNTAQSNTTKAEMVESLLAERAACVGSEQLYKQVAAQLSEHNIKVPNYNTISGSELALIQSVLTSSASGSEKADQIARMYASDSPIVGGGQLRKDAQICVNKVNADVDLDAMTPEQLVQIQLVGGGGESNSTKREMIESIARK